LPYIHLVKNLLFTEFHNQKEFIKFIKEEKDWWKNKEKKRRD